MISSALRNELNAWTREAEIIQNRRAVQHPGKPRHCALLVLELTCCHVSAVETRDRASPPLADARRMSDTTLPMSRSRMNTPIDRTRRPFSPAYVGAVLARASWKAATSESGMKAPLKVVEPECRQAWPALWPVYRKPHRHRKAPLAFPQESGVLAQRERSG